MRSYKDAGSGNVVIIKSRFIEEIINHELHIERVDNICQCVLDQTRMRKSESLGNSSNVVSGTYNVSVIIVPDTVLVTFNPIGSNQLVAHEMLFT